MEHWRYGYDNYHLQMDQVLALNNPWWVDLLLNN